MTYLETGADLSSSDESADNAGGERARIAADSFLGDNRAINRGYTIEHGLGTDRVAVQLRVKIGDADAEAAWCDWRPVDEDGDASDDKLTFFPSSQHSNATRFDWVVIG